MSNIRTISIDWTGEGLKFRGQGTDPASPAIEIDPANETSPGPMLQLFMAAAACSGADVVSILEKTRAGLQSLTIEVTGTRREEHPKRYTAIKYVFRMSGSDLDPSKAERAVSLSLERYCSVIHTLAPDIAVEHEIVIA